MQRKLRRFVVAKSLSARHSLVKHLAPNLYRDMTRYYSQRREMNRLPRPMTIKVKQLLATHDRRLWGAEVGVSKGVNAESILQELPIEKLFLIDPYLPYSEQDFVDGYQEIDYSSHLAEAQSRLSRFGSKVEWVRESSVAASKRFTAGQFDFVYIDGNHDYEFVKQDIAAYLPLVKSGGLLGGHDYQPDYSGVVRAVNEFAERAGCGFYVHFPDWWIVVEPRDDMTS